MGVLTFRGGVHPYEGKELSSTKPIEKLDPGPELVYLMSQHIGAPAKPVVAVGDRVLRGQMIGEAGGFVSAPVYASVSGTVKEIGTRKTATGAPATAVIIENDQKYESVSFEGARLENLSREEILERIRKAGVVGMGGAGFPTAVKLAPKDPSVIDHILVNASECEPYLTSDYRCLMEEPEKIAAGLEVILKLFGPSCEGVICIEDNKLDAAEVMRNAISGKSQMRVAVTKTKYPEGAEHSLIKAITSRDVNSRMLPADAGCIVINVSTAFAIFEAVFLGQPLYRRLLTISGDAVVNPENFYVPTGVAFGEIVEKAGGFLQTPEKLIAGGPMMGFAQSDFSQVVTKTSSALTAFRYDLVSRYKETACINCGRCVDACPARLVPSHLADMVQKKQMEKFEENYGLECVNCGSCSWSCPAGRPLAALVNQGRQTILAARRKAR